MKKFKLVMRLFVIMLKIGLFTFGGGYAMISLLENEFVSKKKWIDLPEFTDMVAIAESTPGPIAINAATYIGYKVAGFWGSFFATLGVCIPSFVIIFAISLFFDEFLKLELVAHAFRGIQVCVVYLILSSGIKFIKQVRRHPLDITLFTLTFVLMTAFSVFAVNFSAVFFLLIGGAMGVIVYFIGYAVNKSKARALLKKNPVALDGEDKDVAQMSDTPSGEDEEVTP